MEGRLCRAVWPARVSQTRVHEQWSYDNWDGGTYGHALYIVVPERLFAFSLQQKNELEEKIRDDLNKIDTVQNEFIEKVFLEVDLPEEGDWREESGLLISGTKPVSSGAAGRIWGDQQDFRLFLSHKAEVKKETGAFNGKSPYSYGSGLIPHLNRRGTRKFNFNDAGLVEEASAGGP